MSKRGLTWQERNEIALRIYEAEDMLGIIQEFINRGGDTRMAILLTRTSALQEWHNTLQQCLMRGFIKPAIMALAGDNYSDIRNEGTVRMCKEILPILDKYSLPFI